MDQEYLAHYGVLGMKWGVRKQKTSFSKSSSTKKKISRKEYKNIVKKNKAHLRKYAKISLYPESVLKEFGYNKKKQ